MIQNAKEMEKLKSICQLIWYTNHAQFSKNYLSAHLTKHFADSGHTSEEVSFNTLLNCALKILLQTVRLNFS